LVNETTKGGFSIMQATIVEIGQKAISEKEAMLIFFNETATELIKEYTIIQRFEASGYADLNVGEKILFGTQEYTIQSVGKSVTEQLEELGHITFFFGSEPPEALINAISLVEGNLPKLEVGMQVIYKAGV
jgi:PTS system glucitol/sorbitol-specific IIA component